MFVEVVKVLEEDPNVPEEVQEVLQKETWICEEVSDVSEEVLEVIEGSHWSIGKFLMYLGRLWMSLI